MLIQEQSFGLDETTIVMEETLKEEYLTLNVPYLYLYYVIH